MGCDQQFYTDVTDGMRTDWQGATGQLQPGESRIITRTFTVSAAGPHVLQYQCPAGLRCTCPQARTPRITTLQAPVTALELHLQQGPNSLDITLTNTRDTPQKLWFKSRILDADGCLVREPLATPLPTTRQPKLDDTPPNLKGFRPGAGKAFQSCGRFGFTKGDGVLDFSMPYFGEITRPFISGHPHYHRHNLWGFSLLPEGEEPTGNQEQRYQLPDNELITADWSHVSWKRNLKNGHQLTFDYSAMTPSLLMETDMDSLRISGLRKTGAYHAVTLPLASGCITRTLSEQDGYDEENDGALAQGWLLLTRTGLFPEVPLLIILAKPLKCLHVKANAQGETTDILLRFSQPLDWAQIAFPYGIQLFQPHEMTDQWHQQAVQHCRDLHQQALARPVACEEWFQCPDDKNLTVLQQFHYRRLEDAWHTPAIQVAPLPPPLILAAEQTPHVMLDDRQQDLEHPTKYGPWHGVINRTWSTYALPVPDYRCHFPMAEQHAGHLGDLIHQDFDDYLAYHLDAPEVGNPGNYSFVFQYAFTAKLFPILQPEDRQRLEHIMAEGIRKVCNPDYAYVGPGGRHCLSWYTRTEPFSQLSWYSTYLHVLGIRNFRDCQRKTIEQAPKPFIEIDWGNAMSLYGCWLGALLSGQWEPIRKQWKVLRKAFDYYLHLMDWPCMTAAYCENGVSWNDGTNYGGYLGFLNMAELIGQHDDFQLARYAYAKMTAMRMGMFCASQHFFYRYLDVDPWYCTKFFHEETDAHHAFLSYPQNIVRNHYRRESFYNMTTEGHYRETWDMLSTYLKPEVLKLLELSEQASPCPVTGPVPVPTEYHTTSDILGWQEVLSWLMLNLDTDRLDDATLERAIEDAARNHRLAREFLGHPEWSKRRVPAEWAHVYLLTQLYGKHLPQLTAWMNLKVCQAVYPIIRISQVEPDAWLEFACPNASPHLTLNGKKLSVTPLPHHRYRVSPPEDGDLTFH